MKKRSIVVIVLSAVFIVTACILLVACNNNKLNDTTQDVRPAGSKELRVTTNIPEAVTVSGSGYYMYNDSIRATATIKEGYEFLGWYVNDDDCVSNQTVYNGKMWNQDVEFSAKVIKKPQSAINDNGGNLSKDKSYVLEVETLDSNYGLVSLNNGRNQEEYTAQYHYGDNFKVLAYSNTETRFIGWYGMSGELITTNATFTMTMPYFDYFLFAVWGNSTDDVNIPKREFSYLLINDKYTVKSYYGGETLVKIPSTYKNKTVTEIGEDCFKNNKTITGIVIPTNVKNIGNSAFSGCSNLKNIFYLGTTEWESIKIAENNTYLKNATIYKYYDKLSNRTEVGDFWHYVDGVPTVCCKHNYKTEVTAPTCTAQGYTTYTCAICGEIYIGNYVNALPHKYQQTKVTAPTCTAQGYTTYTCAICGENYIGNYVNALPHKYQQTKVTAPTCTAQGYTTYTCDVCGKNYIGDYVDILAHEYVDGYCVNCGEKYYTKGLEYGLNSDGSYYVEGIGSAMDNDVVIPDSNNNKPVTSIGDNAFCDCSFLTSVTIGDNVTSIGEYAFEDCSSLTSITIPDSVTSIGYGAFKSCSGLTSVVIPDSVTSIGWYAFDFCNRLTKISIPDSVTSIGYMAFAGCNNLQYYDYDNAYYLGNENNHYVCLIYAKNTSITSCEINENTKIIYSTAFNGCNKLTSIYYTGSASQWAQMDCGYIMSDSRTLYINGEAPTEIELNCSEIGWKSFYYCKDLTKVTIGDGVTSIGRYAFKGCSSLTSVTIGDNVTSIGEYAFEDCSSLTGITFKGTVSQWLAISKWVLWEDDHTCKVQCTDGALIY